MLGGEWAALLSFPPERWEKVWYISYLLLYNIAMTTNLVAWNSKYLLCHIVFMKRDCVGVCFKVSQRVASNVSTSSWVSSGVPKGKGSASNLMNMVVGEIQFLRDWIEGLGSKLAVDTLTVDTPTSMPCGPPQHDSLFYQSLQGESLPARGKSVFCNLIIEVVA